MVVGEDRKLAGPEDEYHEYRSNCHGQPRLRNK